MENVLFAILYLHVYQLLKHIFIIVTHTHTNTDRIVICRAIGFNFLV